MPEAKNQETKMPRSKEKYKGSMNKEKIQIK